MAKPSDNTESAPMKAIRRAAMKLPEAEEGTSCVNRAFRARGKAFAYLGMKDDCYTLRLKLRDSIPRAEALQEKQPDYYSVGMAGWTLVRLPHSKSAPKGLLEKWIEESFRLIAPKALVATLPTKK